MFTNPNSRPPQTTDIITLESNDGKFFTYYWNDIFKATLYNMSTQVSTTGVSSKTVTHNLGYNPKVTVFDGNGLSIMLTLTYVDGVSFTVDFGTSSPTATIEYL